MNTECFYCSWWILESKLGLPQRERTTLSCLWVCRAVGKPQHVQRWAVLGCLPRFL